MKDTFLNARLVAPDLIRLVIFSSVPFDKLDTRLVVDREKEVVLHNSRFTSTSSTIIAEYKLAEDLPLGHSYALALSSYGLVPLDANEATTFPNFDEDYYYDGSDLGANFGKDSTSFSLWAPLASTVFLRIRKEGEDSASFHKMERTAKGVYRLTLKGDYELATYHYLVTNSEITAACLDPYARCSLPNGKASVVADFSKLKADFHKEALPVLDSYCESVIYETSVRDITIDRHSDIEAKGTFKGLTEKGRKTFGGLPAGFDYIKSLGITHLQLMPVYDFKTVDEENPKNSYNWGYDPAQYFLPEGSYSSDVDDPYSRIREFQDLVSSFHLAGIRIVMDVVFNHVYEYLSSVYEKVVPNYFFRRRGNGKMACTSGCGDDLASERPMVRKLIVDAALWWIKTYGIDGYRFDLMGIIDCDTLLEIEKKARAIYPNFMLYGEGWDMGGEVHLPLGNMGNCRLLPNFAFFNDLYRDSIKGWIASKNAPNEWSQFAYVSSSLDFYHGAKFLSANQTLNYIECHDNATFFDFLSKAQSDDQPANILLDCKLGLATVLTSIGIPFIHMGQEIGQSKFGKDNTYNLPDLYNRFSYRLLDERKDMYEYAKSLIAFRKKMPFFRVYDPRVIDRMLSVETIGKLFCSKVCGEEFAYPYKEVTFLYNSSDEPCYYSFAEDHLRLIDQSGEVSSSKIVERDVQVPSRTMVAYAIKGGK